MTTIQTFRIFVFFVVFSSAASNVFGQDRPDLLFREDWKEIPAAIPVNQNHVANADLILHLYGPGIDSLKKSHHDQPADDPYYIWSGLCAANWALALEHNKYLINMTGFSKIRWRTKQFGFRHLHIIVHQQNGQWLVSDLSDAASSDWRIQEFNIGDIRWRKLNINSITEGLYVDNPDLSAIDQIGFTDLMQGGKSDACSRLDWIEVYAFRKARKRN